MRETHLHLLRHGETAGGDCYRGSRDDALTALGWEQMRQALGDNAPWVRIISSPLIRCRAFAEELAQRHALPLEIDERLREIHFGEWEGKTAEELLSTDHQRITRFWADPVKYPPPGGEAISIFRQRVLTVWQQLCGQNTGNTILIVTHGGPIRVILGQVLDLTWDKTLQLEIPHAYYRQLPLMNDVAMSPG